MLAAIGRALRDTFSSPLRGLLWRSLGLSLVFLVALAVAAQWALGAMPEIGVVWIDAPLEILARFFVIVLLVPLVVPATSIAAGLFLEQAAARVEARSYPHDPPGRDQSLGQSLRVGAAFAAVQLAVNLIALPLYLLPGVNLLLFWLVNGYLLGREYFELVALRHDTVQEARRRRRANAATVFGAGIAVALFMTVPVLNLLAPLFATALMVHVNKRIANHVA